MIRYTPNTRADDKQPRMYGVTVVQIYTYHRRSRADPLILKSSVRRSISPVFLRSHHRLLIL
ncbi:hypothetical protein OBBRIDRAFT_790531 [Obba rivulosa]|uniref:Uncharacterized protein n=1 Tax=Obba rivulosa TaxID=1052685 RepID=A0A8E2DP71_9APHY|nr:hypothetical protein OBBRIDRAFT_790531 [Obba rivulosa]